MRPPAVATAWTKSTQPARRPTAAPTGDEVISRGSRPLAPTSLTLFPRNVAATRHTHAVRLVPGDHLDGCPEALDVLPRLHQAGAPMSDGRVGTMESAADQ